MLAWSVTTIVMNNVLIRIVGYEGVAAAGIMFVAQGLLMSLFLGYSTGIAPIVSFNYGTGDTLRIRRLFRRSLGIIACASVLAIAIGWFAAGPIASIYVPAGIPIHAKAVTAIRIGLLGFLFMGFNQFASVFFTALSNWIDSSLLAAARTFVFFIAMLSLLPALLDVTGVWLALPAAEALAIVTTTIALSMRAKRYGYGRLADTVLESSEAHPITGVIDLAA
jgi:Na+-driven multidrug efflux pump